MIIQTGNHTDIPAFYSEWFANRLKEGYVLVRNPFNPQSVTRYALNPLVVDLLVFCSKNPRPLLKYMNLLEAYHQYWFVTITPYGKELDPNVPDKSIVMETFRQLSSITGPGNICWRYDPILIDETWTASRHIEHFREMCKILEESTHTAVISFIDLYEKVKRNFPEAKTVPFHTQLVLTEAFVDIGKKYGMTIKPCRERLPLVRKFFFSMSPFFFTNRKIAADITIRPSMCHSESRPKLFCRIPMPTA